MSNRLYSSHQFNSYVLTWEGNRCDENDYFRKVEINFQR